MKLRPPLHVQIKLKWDVMHDPHGHDFCPATHIWQKVQLWEHTLNAIMPYYRGRGSLILGALCISENQAPSRGDHVQLGWRVLCLTRLLVLAAPYNYRLPTCAN